MVQKQQDELNAFLYGEDTSDEVEKYISLKVNNQPQFDVLNWWKSQTSNLPTLGKFAKQFLSIPASSASSERVFSRSNLFVTNLRTILTSEHAEMLTYISVNHTMNEEVEQVALDW